MKKTIAFASALCACASVFAGGLNTNTNQNAAFLRQMSQESIIDINGLYMNPAGTAFLSEGSHLSINIQNAKQSRDITTTFPLFALNSSNSNATHKFEGDAYAPVIPSIQYSYNWDKWSLNLNFALCGGGGKCEFDKGLGSFEALYAGNIFSQKDLLESKLKSQLPLMVTQGIMQAGLDASTASMLAGMGTYNAKFAGYDLNAYMKGKQYYFGLTLGGTYKVTENLAVSAGLKGIYAMCNYNGYVQDINAYVAYDYNVPAVGVFPGTSASDVYKANLDDSSLALNADQTGFGFAPVFGVDWKINEHWNVAAKYEFKTRLRLENKSEMNEFTAATAATNPTLGQFADGSTIAADQASFLAAGVQYSPIKSLRLQAGYHLYGDKNATQYGDKQDLIDDNTWEVTAGVEYDLCKWIKASCGWQVTKYGMSDAYMNDLSFNTNSNSLGLGVNVFVTDHCNIDLGYMVTLYDKREVTSATAAGPKTDVYERTNRVLGIGFNFQF